MQLFNLAYIIEIFIRKIYIEKINSYFVQKHSLFNCNLKVKSLAFFHPSSYYTSLFYSPHAKCISSVDE